MHLRAGVVLCLGLCLATAVALADTYYKYRDPRTGRDVFVNRLEQVPRRYRDGAQVVLQTEDGAASADEQPPAEVLERPPSPGRPTLRTVTPARSLPIDFRRAFSGKQPWKDGPELFANALDSTLASSGSPPLTTVERRGLDRLFLAIMVGAVVASLAFLAAWLAIIIIAIRNGHTWWGVLIFLFSPLAFLYLFLHLGPGRALLKTACCVAMLSPILVGSLGAWRLHAWFQAIAQARGGRL
jgi:hypothetical protein